MIKFRTLVACGAICITGCTSIPTNPTHSTFGEDLAFLTKHTDAIVLSDPLQRARIVVVPQYQGRVMTSTAAGDDGDSFGWINRPLIASGEQIAHMNPYGGEDRFWMGPEGGQFAIFFAPDAPFEMFSWQTPAVIDTLPFTLISSTSRRALFRKSTRLTNRAGTDFSIRIDRTVRLLNPIRVRSLLDIDVPTSINLVAYETDNRITNEGDRPWTKESGLLSVWILGMFRPSPHTTVVIPFQPGPEASLGPIVNDAYFGKVPADRLLIADGVLFFRADGQHRSKIGLSPARSRNVAGSYDQSANHLTIVQYTKPDGVTSYVNSMWELQEKPYSGDVVNSYNDGPPPGGGSQLGPFYELESSSPALALNVGEHVAHIHRTFHFQGPEADLNTIATHVLGVSLDKIKQAFPAKTMEQSP